MSEENGNGERRKRALTDEDTEAIAEKLERRMVQRFYLNLGKGIWSLAWKVIVIALIALAAYGAAKGGFGGLFK